LETRCFSCGGSFFFPLFARGCCLCFRFAFGGFGLGNGGFLLRAKAFLFGDTLCNT
jgi:hypothetical protein